MNRTVSTFEIDPTPRRADGEFMAHARIMSPAIAGEASRVFMSGDLAGFDERGDAIEFARNWAREWIDARLQSASRRDGPMASGS